MSRTRWTTLFFNVVIASLLGAGLFGVFGLLGRWDRLPFVVFAGLACGALVVPEFEPKLIPFPAVYQTFVGAVLGGVIGFAFSSPLDWFIVAVFGGAIIGFLAPYWLKYIHPVMLS